MTGGGTGAAWRCRDLSLPAGERTLVMGILNVTPDSFSDGGRFLDRAAAVAHARAMLQEGADIIDVGGESTRPGAEPVAEDEEIRRVVPIVEALAADLPDAALSVDTMKAPVARAAIAAGAHIVNDVSALRADPAMTGVIAASGAGVVLMHMLGEPRTMQKDPRYDDVVAEVASALGGWAAGAQAGGIARDRIVVDPGIGFGKTLQHNLGLLRGITDLRALGYPVLIGASRKSFIATALGLPVGERLEATAAAVAWSVAQGAAVVRVHDVKEMVRVVRMTEAIRGPLDPVAAWHDGAPADRIVVRGLRVFGYHGVHAHEKERGQDFLVDLEAHLDLRPAGAADDLARTLDYSDLTRRARAIVAGEPHDLIEALAEQLAAAVLEYPGVRRAVVRVGKPQALATQDVEGVFVEIERRR